MNEKHSLPIVLIDYKTNENIKRALTYLKTLTLEELLEESSKINEKLIDKKDSIVDAQFPNIKQSSAICNTYTMRPSQYLPLIYTVISSKLQKQLE